MTLEERRARLDLAAKHATEAIRVLTEIFGSLEIEESSAVAAGAARAEAIRLRLMVDGLAVYLGARGEA